MKAKLRLVLVEDDPADGEIIARHLANAHLDCLIHRVQTEAGLLAALAEVQPDLILSDFTLPRFNGLRALTIANTHAPETPFIFVSGTIGEERAIEAMREGATDYVLKANLARLSSSVERALREASIKAQQRDAERQKNEHAARLERLTRSYRMLSHTSSAILRLRNRTELLDEVCRIAVKHGGYDRAVISLIDATSNSLKQRACAGVDSKPLRAMEFAALDANEKSMSLAQQAIHERAPRILSDLGTETAPTAHQQIGLAQGWRAVAALPLIIDGTAVGAMTLFSAQRGVFDQPEVGVLLELSANLCFALQYLDKDEALNFLAHFDGLTGLAKRPLLCQRLAQRLAAQASEGSSLTVVVFDIQKLGTINDTLGRYVGDLLIEAIAARIKKVYPSSECAAYLGGGTFALMVPTVDGADIEDTGRRIQGTAAQFLVEPFLIGEEQLRPAIRCGIAVHPHDGDAADALVQNAEAALKAAHEGNEKCMMYELVTRRPTSRSLALEARLTGALDKQEYLLHYQPKVDIADGQIVGFEALLRWQDGEAGLVPPSIFIPLLERSGAIVEVGEWILRQAVQDVRAWMAEGVVTARVAVNVSPLQLRRRDFVQGVLSSIEPFAGVAAGLDIEITESMLMQDIELSIRKLSELRDAGIGIAIDDFGTGYSSLRLLSRLPVDTLKIDASFIQGITDTPHVMTLVATIVSLARAFDMQTVAEGVETAEQLSMLRVVACDQAQGFYLGRPAPAVDIPALIRELSPGPQVARARR